MSCARNVRAGAKIVSEDDVYLDARVVFLIECLRHPRKTRRFHTGAVENHPRASQTAPARSREQSDNGSILRQQDPM